jgi:hypothetical protein
MGLFKKIGNAIKKGAKQISLKNIVKLGTPLLSAIPIVGGIAQSTVQGITDANQAKKDAQLLAEQGRLEEAALMEQKAQVLASNAGANVGQVAGNTLNAFARGATDELIASASVGTQKVAGQVGAGLVDFTIKEWFTKHWKTLVGLIVVVFSVVFFWRRSRTSNKKPYAKKPR